MRRINKYIPISIQNYFHEKKAEAVYLAEFEKWKKEGRPIPPPHAAKQEIIASIAKQFNCEIFIETGTYLGDTMQSQRKNFRKLISIELAQKLFRAASKRFSKFPEIAIYQGNSGDVLHKIMPEIRSRALLWLDGHYSGGITAKGKTECPVFNELDAVFSNNSLKHIVLIDDARLFIGKRDYPTMDELREYIKMKDPDYKIRVDTDIIMLTV
ncbi:MAG TPA: hypothetical protein VK207_04705 [Bacteroidales bacterium]|nr:hypothetical protein [Bacteroidales bacterium]